MDISADAIIPDFEFAGLDFIWINGLVFTFSFTHFKLTNTINTQFEWVFIQNQFVVLSVNTKTTNLNGTKRLNEIK